MTKKAVGSTEEKVLKLTEWLSDEQEWNWTHMLSNRNAADAVLAKMAELGLIQHKNHPYGGNIWIVGDKKFGRVNY